jgi:Rod binding domain-containing protein
MTASLLPTGDITTTMNALPLSAKPNTAAIDKTAQSFEEMFATQLLQPMFASVGVNPTFGGGHGEEVMRSFLTQEYGKLVAKSGKLGIAAQVKTEMLRAQEAATRHATSSVASNSYVQGGTNVAIQ